MLSVPPSSAFILASSFLISEKIDGHFSCRISFGALLSIKFQDLYTKSRFSGNSIVMLDNATAGGNSSCVAHNAT